MSRYPVVYSIGRAGERHHRARNWVRHGESADESRPACSSSLFDVTAVPDRYPGAYPQSITPMSDADYRRAVKAGAR